MKRNLFSIVGKSSLTAGALSLLLLSSCEKATQEMSPANEDSPTSLKGSAVAPGQEYVPNELLVKFRQGTSAENKAKALEMIGGKPMIEHVVERARAANLGEVIVATDSEPILAAVEKAGHRALHKPADYTADGA